jgi:hypothetical protein
MGGRLPSNGIAMCQFAKTMARQAVIILAFAEGLELAEAVEELRRSKEIEILIQFTAPY